KEIIQMYQSEILSFHKLILFTSQHCFENYFELPILMLSTKNIDKNYNIAYLFNIWIFFLINTI
ncbi:MAG: hypothetical protein ACK55I_33380, partial [bacterium]